MSYGLIATLIVLAIVIGAITTKKMRSISNRRIDGGSNCFVETRLPDKMGQHT